MRHGPGNHEGCFYLTVIVFATPAEMTYARHSFPKIQPALSPVGLHCFTHLQSHPIVGTGRRVTTDSSKKTKTSMVITAKCAAISTDLVKLINAWPELTEPLKAAILLIVAAS
jgi:hypothetical protein